MYLLKMFWHKDIQNLNNVPFANDVHEELAYNTGDLKSTENVNSSVHDKEEDMGDLYAQNVRTRAMIQLMIRRTVKKFRVILSEAGNMSDTENGETEDLNAVTMKNTRKRKGNPNMWKKNVIKHQRDSGKIYLQIIIWKLQGLLW
ncbi:hypothetical protein ILUMI_20688 [Ignelater luminosus]|uniref:Uncharacterized protein n=1 Tax=Ignelater luminosus TaxID=2038154 RepID=A0A8K0FYN9_IGNLU|nr:hypothetical protein ILUMI_20688 [Ignelater luminosus]